MIRNPVVRGFNPDPSIVRVEDDYYLATSTFEWFPGIQIHHSKDLEHWRLVTRPLSRASQLDLRGCPDSCGVWAPCLTHRDGVFFLTYSVVRRYGRTTVQGSEGVSLRDFRNFVITADRIDGTWSDPVYLNASGFDPSLFHNDDGKTYLLNMLWDHRLGHNRFAGIVLQEFDRERQVLVGDADLIFTGTALGFTEGPHLYKREGWYYLIVAEGGTGWDHAVVMARSRDLRGPYEVSPHGAVLTSRGRPDLPLQRAGHGDLVEGPDGAWWLAYLCARPLPGTGRCVLGRETAIQPVRWLQDGWLEPSLPVLEARGPAGLAPPSPEVRRVRYDFDGPSLPGDFQWLRTPEPETIFSLDVRPGCLTLFGRESIGSHFEQALVARRQYTFCFAARTVMDYSPHHFQQSAGLVCYYNATKFHYCYVTFDDVNGRHLRVMSALPDLTEPEAVSRVYALPDGPVELKVEGAYAELRFAFRPLGHDTWTDVVEVFDATILSDEATLPGHASFTGAFVGIACQDMSGQKCAAHFDGFEYEDLTRPPVHSPLTALETPADRPGAPPRVLHRPPNWQTPPTVPTASPSAAPTPSSNRRR